MMAIERVDIGGIDSRWSWRVSCKKTLRVALVGVVKGQAAVDHAQNRAGNLCGCGWYFSYNEAAAVAAAKRWVAEGVRLDKEARRKPRRRNSRRAE